MQIQDVTAKLIARSYVRQAGGSAIGARQEAAIRQPASRPRTDSLDLSGATQLMREAQAAVGGQSEVRGERVAALRAALANGSYQIDTQALAARLLR